MSNGETEPFVITDLPGDQPEGPWQHASDVAWSFGYRRRRLFASVMPLAPSDSPLPQQNANGSDTTGPQRVKVPNLGPVGLPARRLGKRAWRALAQWEGVVEHVVDDGFRVRLTPLVDGRPDFTRQEFTEFSFDELAYEADRPLIAPNVVIYWTVGRRKDEAGTQHNESFVRVRRQVPLSDVRKRRAAAEINAILAEIEGQE